MDLPRWLWVTLVSAAKACIYLYEVAPFRQIPTDPHPRLSVRPTPRFSDAWYLASPRYCPGRGRCPSGSFRSVHRVSDSFPPPLRSSYIGKLSTGHRNLLTGQSLWFVDLFCGCWSALRLSLDRENPHTKRVYNLTAVSFWQDIIRCSSLDSSPGNLTLAELRPYWPNLVNPIEGNKVFSVERSSLVYSLAMNRFSQSDSMDL